jgi:hypothetical protein
MKSRVVSRDEAEKAFTRELSGDAFHLEQARGTISAIHLPPRPVAGGSQGNGFLPLTYEVRLEGGGIETISSDEGPDVEEARAFLYATLTDRVVGQRLEFWFEGEPQDLQENLGCCC